MTTCRKCGHENPDGTRFCGACEAYVGWGRPQPPTRVAAATPPPRLPAHDATEAAPLEDDEQDRPVGDRWKVRVIELGRSSRTQPEPAADEVQAVKPDEQRRRPPPRRTPAPPPPVRQPRPGQVRCGNCGRYNEPTNRFCRCGAQLATPAKPIPAPAPPSAPPLPWYRRILGASGGANRGSVRQATRAARIGYDQALSLRARWVRVLLVLGALGIGVTTVAPWGASPRGWVGDQVARVRGYETVAVSAAVVEPPVARRVGFLPAYATDGQPTRAWAVGWPGADRAAPQGACGQVKSRAGGVLLVSFAQESRIDRVTVQAGLDRKNPEWSKQARPRNLELRFSNGDCHRIALKDGPEPQAFDVEARAVTEATVVVLDAYRHLEGSGKLVAISEIAFAHRR